MADPTPPSDVPNPPSSIPANPKPGPSSTSAETSGYKRIRSMPDRPAGSRPVGSIRSMPEPAYSSRQGAATYVSLGSDRSWKAGIGILGALFVWALLAEAFNAAGFLLAGRTGWPLGTHVAIGGMDFSAIPLEVIRLVLVSTLFIALWSGQQVVRFLLSLSALLCVAWLLAQFIPSYREAPKFYGNGSPEAVVYSTPEMAAKVFAFIAYLLIAGFAVLSMNVREFLVHRRRRGGAGSALLVTVLVYASLAAILCAQPMYNKWLHGQRASALAFASDTLNKMSADWAPTAIDDRIDREFGKQFTPNGRRDTFTNFKDLGHLVSANALPEGVRPVNEANPFQKLVPEPTQIESRPTKDGSGFEVEAKYKTTGTEFEHGKVSFSFTFVRDFSGPWRLTAFDAADVQIDRPHRTPPPAEPGASPAPDAVSGASSAASPAATTPGAVPSASLLATPTPTATTSTMPVDAAAPTPAASVAPTTSPIPTVPLTTPVAPTAPAVPPATTPAASPASSPAS